MITGHPILKRICYNFITIWIELIRLVSSLPGFKLGNFLQHGLLKIGKARHNSKIESSLRCM